MTNQKNRVIAGSLNFRKLLVVAAGLWGVFLFASDLLVSNAEAQCASRTTVPAGGAFIYKQSAPLRNRRGTLIGYRYEPTLIGNRRGILSRAGTTIYNSKLGVLARCPWASADGHAGGRYRCTVQTATLRRAAIRTSGSPAILFTLTGSACALVPDAGRCFGSVKGPCNRLIS